MTHSAELIEQVKTEIRYKARYMNLPFDEEDIEHHEIEDHTLVALMRINRPDTWFDGEEVIKIGDKTANIWVDYPSPLLSMPERDQQGFITSFRMPLPMVHIVIPSLVYLILPDGTVKGDEAFYSLHGCIERQNAEQNLAHLLGDIWNRPGECSSVKAACS